MPLFWTLSRNEMQESDQAFFSVHELEIILYKCRFRVKKCVTNPIYRLSNMPSIPEHSFNILMCGTFNKSFTQPFISFLFQSRGCMKSSKGRDHPQIKLGLENRIRSFFRPFNKRFYRFAGYDFGWK